MKIFTSLMKALITIVSISLVVMLVMSTAPLVMGGIEVENTEEIQITSNGSNLNIEGKFTVKSSLPKDITDLTLSIDAISMKDNDLEGVNIWSEPPRNIKPGTNTVIDIDATINIAEIIMFLLADTGSDKGIFLPIQISLSAGYGGLAALDVDVVKVVELSKEAQLDTHAQLNSEGKIYSATAEFTGGTDDMLLDMIPDGGLDAELFADGVSGKVYIHIDKDAGSNFVSVSLKTGDGPESIGIMDLAKKMLEEGDAISISSNGMGIILPADQIADIAHYMDIFLGGVTDVE